jgi:hypothetical protein
MEELFMQYLDISPLIASLQVRPYEFEMKGDWLEHIPSRHRFKVDSDGIVRIEAQCDCTDLVVKRQQGRDFRENLRHWREAYWRPVEINREFASHFRAPNIWQRLYRNLILIFVTKRRVA